MNEFLKLLKHTGLFDSPAVGSGAVPSQGSSCAATSSSSSSSSGGSGSNTSTCTSTSSSNLDRQNSSQGASSSASSESTNSSVGTGDSVVHILDCGCGSSHLTFTLWHYVHNVLGGRASITGVDTNAALMARSNQYW